jgi:hypothetical protein
LHLDLFEQPGQERVFQHPAKEGRVERSLRQRDTTEALADRWAVHAVAAGAGACAVFRSCSIATKILDAMLRDKRRLNLRRLNLAGGLPISRTIHVPVADLISELVLGP